MSHEMQQTSIDAYEAIKYKLGASQRRVLDVF